jgi:putative membrane protein
MLDIKRTAAAGLVLAVTLAACSKNNGANDSTNTAAGRIDTAGTPANPSATPTTDSAAAANNGANAANNKWTANAVIGFATAANEGEVQMGRLGEKKAKDAAVKGFARQMVTDHSAMLAETRKLGAKTKATPDTTMGDVHDLMGHSRDEMKELTDKAAGADWDKNYMDKMVDDHKNVLDKLQDAAKNTTDPDTKKALETAVGKVQTHLTKAQDIRAKMP